MEKLPGNTPYEPGPVLSVTSPAFICWPPQNQISYLLFFIPNILYTLQELNRQYRVMISPSLCLSLSLSLPLCFVHTHTFVYVCV